MVSLRVLAIVACSAAGVLPCVSPAYAADLEETWNRCLNQNVAKIEHLTPDDVIAACRRVLNGMAYAPNVRADAFNNIGATLSEAGRFEEAVRYYSDALWATRDYQQYPEYRQLANYTLQNRARAYIRLKQYDEALEDFEAIVRKEPLPKHYALRCKARALWAKDFASALPDCKKAIDAGEGLSNAYVGWLVVEYRQGKFADVASKCALIKNEPWLGTEVSFLCLSTVHRLDKDKDNKEEYEKILLFMREFVPELVDVTEAQGAAP